MKHFSLGLLAVFLTVTATVEAYDQQVTSTLWAEGYSVQTPGGAVLRRRRFVEDLRLGAWNLIQGSDHPYYRGPRLSIEIALRLDTDFGVARNESRSSAESAYIPGLTAVQFDTMVAYLDARGLWNDTLGVRAGRQIRIDTLGFFAFDGAEIRLQLPIGVRLDTYLGYEVRGGQMMGYDQLELDGTDNGGRHDMESNLFPDRKDPVSRLVIGTELLIAPWDWFDAGLSFRAVGLSQPLADERLGGRLALGREPVRADARVVWSPLLDLLTEVDGEIAVTPVELLVVYLEYHYYKPMFEGDSIFNVFDLMDQNDLGGRVEVRLTKKISGAAWGFARLQDSSAGLSGNEEDALVVGAGGGIGGNYRTPSQEIHARFNMVHEWGESRYGGEIGGRQALLRSQRLWLGVRCSIWHIDDAFSKRLTGDLGGYVLSARFRIADGAHLLGEFENYVSNNGRDPFFSILALFQLDLWR